MVMDMQLVMVRIAIPN
jgi:hypothetical protein